METGGIDCLTGYSAAKAAGPPTGRREAPGFAGAAPCPSARSGLSSFFV